MPTNGMTGSTTIADMMAISAIAVNGSSLIFRNAFQPAWQAAPNSTAKKTEVSTSAFCSCARRIVRRLEACAHGDAFARDVDLEARRKERVVHAHTPGRRVAQRHDAADGVAVGGR